MYACMKCMILIMIMQQNYADDLECQNERLHQQLEGFGLGSYDVGTSTARTSELTREWSPWPDTYQNDDSTRGWSHWLDTPQQDN